MAFAFESTTHLPEPDRVRTRYDWTRAAMRPDYETRIPYGPQKSKKRKKKGAKQKISPEKRGKAGVADLYIRVYTPAKITAQAIMAKQPLDAPSSGLSFELARHAKFRQDESVMCRLRWTSPGSRVPAAKQPETNAHFKHDWTSKTENRPDLPGNPIMLEATDGHIYGLSVVPGLRCEQEAMKRTPAFDRKKNDWTFVSDGQFIDTVRFAKRTIKRTYYFHYESSKKGSKVKASVNYTNVDEVNKV